MMLVTVAEKFIYLVVNVDITLHRTAAKCLSVCHPYF